MFILTISEMLRRRRYRKDLPSFLEILSPQRVDVILDVGAGTGWIASKVASLCDETYALEPRADLLEFMTRKHPEVKAFSATAQSVPFPEKYFDKVYVVFAFHHLQDQEDSLEEFHRILKPGGVLLIHEYFRSQRGVSFFEARFMKSKVNFLDPADLESLLDAHGFNRESVQTGSNGYFLLARNSEP